MSAYADFLSGKRASVTATGFDLPADSVHPLLFDWQREIVRWALRLGRAAIFSGCGTGKTLMQLEWARHAAAHAGGRVLILAPLAVTHQTVAEAGKIGLAMRYCRSQAEAAAAPEAVLITNYDMLHEFDADRFAAVVLDESGILKAFTGKLKREILRRFRFTPYKLACTATPAPNDHLELGNHADFLGLMASNEMISRWFINNTMAAGDYRLKKHAEADFWRWVASWAVCMSRPSDLGYPDDGFELPPLSVHTLPVAIAPERAFAQGRLFFDPNVSATAMWREKGASAEDRCRAAAGLVAQDPGAAWLLWCETNQEADILKRHIPEAVEVRGSQSVAVKEERLAAFADGRARILITKPDIAGFGLNFQHCARQVFVSVSYSFERTYQALRRSWRFRQTRPVHAWLVCAENEAGILDALRAKEAAHGRMQAAMRQAMRDVGLCRATEPHQAVACANEVPMGLPAWIEEDAA